MQSAVAPLQRFNAAMPFCRVTGGQISRSTSRGCALFFAVICAWTGERDLAIEQLETLAKIPAARITANSVSIPHGIGSAATNASKES
jgi:hypothetical protein